jgi:hypothetical protein
MALQSYVHKKPVQIDVVIVNYNSTSYLIECISSLYTAAKGVASLDICVFDNGSSDSVGRIKGSYPQVCLVCNRENIGFARAVNKAMGLGKAGYVLVLNPDTRVDKEFFARMIKYMEANSDVGILGPRIYDSRGRIQGSARKFPTFRNAVFGRTTLFSRLFPNNPGTLTSIPAYSCRDGRAMDVDWVSGACMVVRKKAVNQVGGLDEKFFMYWEDADWCRRMRQNQWRVVYCPDCSIVHYTGVSSRKNLIKSILEFHKSAYYLFCKSSDDARPGLLKGIVFSALFFRAYVLIMMQVIPGFKRIR